MCAHSETVSVSVTVDEGYKLTKTYYIKAGDTTQVVFDGSFVMPKSDVTIYAEFEAIYYTITFKNYDGTILYEDSFAAETTPGYNGATPTKPADEEFEYIFAGWSPTIATVTGDAVYTARFTQSLRLYNISKATITNGTLDCSSAANVGETVFVMTEANIGYELSKTYYIKSGDTEKFEFEDNFDMPTSDITVYAEFTAITYVITYNLNGGTLPTGTVDSYTIIDTITLPTPTKTGYEFIGWYTSASFTGSVVTTIPTGSTGNKVYYAKFVEIIPDYVVTLASTPVSVPGVTLSHTRANYGDTITIILPQGYTPPTGKQIHMSYKYTDDDEISPTDIVDNAFTMPRGDVTVSVILADIVYLINKSSVTNGKLTCASVATYEEEVSVTATPNDGYTLKRTYYIADSSTAEVEFTGSFTMPASKVTVYAEFEKETPMYGGYKYIASGETYTVENGETISGYSAKYGGAFYVADGGELIIENGTIENCSAERGGAVYVAKGGKITIEPDAIVVNCIGTEIDSLFYLENGAKVTINGGTLISETGDHWFTEPAKTYTITLNYNSSYGTVQCQATASAGDTVTLTVTPNTDYEVLFISYAGETTDPQPISIADLTFTMPAENISISIVFQEISRTSYSITLKETANSIAGVTLSHTKAYEGDTITITLPEDFELAEGYELMVEYRDDFDASEYPDGLTFTMPAYDITVYVEACLVVRTISKGETTNGSFTVVSQARYGARVSVTATPDEGYRFSRSYYQREGNITTVEFTDSFIMPEYNITVYVEFEKNPVFGGYKYIASGETYTVEDGEVIFGYNAKYGGAFYVADGGELIITNATIGDCSAVQGGAIYVANGGVARLELVSIDSCEATVNGGAIYVEDGGTLIFGQEGTIENCSANKGGAVYVADGGTADVKGGTYHLCSANTNQGDIFYSEYDGELKLTTFNAEGYFADDSLWYQESTPAEEYTITINYDSTYGTVQCQATARVDETVILTVTPNTDYEVDAIYYNGETIEPQVIDADDLTFIMPAENININISFQKCSGPSAPV